MLKQMRRKEVLVETQKTNLQLKEGLVEMHKSRYNRVNFHLVEIYE